MDRLCERYTHQQLQNLSPVYREIDTHQAYGEIYTCPAYGEIDTCPAYWEIDTCPAYRDIDTCPAFREIDTEFKIACGHRPFSVRFIRMADRNTTCSVSAADPNSIRAKCTIYCVVF